MFEAQGPSEEGYEFVHRQGVEDLQGNEYVWSIGFQMSNEGRVADGYQQVLWDPVSNDEIMLVERSEEGDVLGGEKSLINEQFDFLIHYGEKSTIVDIVECNFDSDDWYPEDLEPMFDDKAFYTSTIALPSRFGEGAQAPDIPRY